MIGTLFNAGAVVLGGAVGLTVGKDLSAQTQVRIKNILGVLIVYLGLSTTWKALHGPFGHFLRQLFVVGLALVLGNLAGRLMGLQKHMTRLGRWAVDRFYRHIKSSNDPNRFSDGFVSCTLLFCVGPMAILGALQDGLSGKIDILALKSVLDGLSAAAFARTFGWGVLLSAVPLLAYQGSLTLGAAAVQPMLANAETMNAINATGGLLMVCVAMLVFEAQKAPVANYLPSLVIAPALAKLLL